MQSHLAIADSIFVRDLKGVVAARQQSIFRYRLRIFAGELTAARAFVRVTPRRLCAAFKYTFLARAGTRGACLAPPGPF